MPRGDGTGPTTKHKFLVMSSQGGVGKTSVIVNLAVALSKRGLKVGLIIDKILGGNRANLSEDRSIYADL